MFSIADLQINATFFAGHNSFFIQHSERMRSAHRHVSSERAPGRQRRELGDRSPDLVWIQLSRVQIGRFCRTCLMT